MPYNPYDPFSQDPYGYDPTQLEPEPGQQPPPPGQPQPLPPGGAMGDIGRQAALAALPASAPATAPATAPSPSPYNREALSSAIQGLQFGGTPQYNPTEFIGQHQGDFAQGVQMVSPDKIRLPDGEIVDIGSNIQPGGTGGAWWGSNVDWNKANAASGGAMARAEAAGRGAGGGGGGQFGAGGAAGGAGGGMNVDPELRAALLRLMGRSEPGAINPLTDPNLAPQANAYSAARTRGAEAERAKLAERAAFEGFNPGGAGSGAFTQGVADIGERAGQDIAGQQAGLVGQEVAAKRADLMNALQIANAIGARDQAGQIQQQLAQLENQFQYARLGQQGSQFENTFGLERVAQEENLRRLGYLAGLRQ